MDEFDDRGRYDTAKPVKLTIYEKGHALSQDDYAFLKSHDTISQVRVFMDTAGQTVMPAPRQPDTATLKLRLSLELEELYEKAQAMGLEQTFCSMMIEKAVDYIDVDYIGEGIYTTAMPNGQDSDKYDPVALLDACVDQCYVADGTILACGLQEAFPEAFSEVHRSNLSKFPDHQKRVDVDTRWLKEQGIDATITEAGNGRWVIRRADGKVLKSTGFTPPDLAPILAKYSSPAPSSGD